MSPPPGPDPVRSAEGTAQYPFHWRRASAAIIFDPAGRVLLVHHTYLGNHWSLPGGHSEPGEDPMATVVREVSEETGLRVTPCRLTGVYYEPEYELVHFGILCTPDDPGTTPTPDGDEVSECAFFPPDRLPRPMKSITERRIRDALEPHPPPLPVVFRRGEETP